jgi:hypothetical protein
LHYNLYKTTVQEVYNLISLTLKKQCFKWKWIQVAWQPIAAIYILLTDHTHTEIIKYIVCLADPI